MMKDLYTKEMTESDTHQDAYLGTHMVIHKHRDCQARNTHYAFDVKVYDGERRGENLGEYVAKANSPQKK